ncbi:MAG: thiol:disulfide interchange protein DsbA/DsbL [Tatlockia sp.]|nr:thiol:disulfide interchange protein DsbA/DsbL [Tatlockia sp.]
MLKRLVLIILLVLPLIAAAEDFVAGTDYVLIKNGAETGTDKTKVRVDEFFSYGCHWCYQIDSALVAWVKQKGNTIQFSKVPVVFNEDWIFYAKAYYTAQRLGLDEKLNPILFKEIQGKTKRALASNQAMIDFFIAQGVDPATAKSAFENSTTIDLEVKQGTGLMARYQIKGIPAVIINNQYKADLQMAKSEGRFIKILDFLVSKAKEEKLKTKS